MIRHVHLALLAGAWLAIGGCIAAPHPTPAAPPRATIPPPATVTPAASPSAVPPAATTMPNILGVHLLLDDGRNLWPTSIWADHVAAARAIVGPDGFVVQLVRSDDLDVDRWQLWLDLCARHRLQPILRLATTYDREAGYWRAPPADVDEGYATVATDYARFVAALRWPTDRHPVLVGNEPNHGDEWSGRADPAAYARFLADVADALHATDPAALVLNAPLDPYSPHTNDLPFINGFTYVDSESFLDEMRAAVPDVFERLDGWASHPYPTGPLANGPWDQTYQIDRINGAVNTNAMTAVPGLFNRGINGYEWELAKLETYGITELEVWITETGWRHAESADAAASDNGRAWPTIDTMADWIDLALNGNAGRYPQWPDTGWRPWRHDPRVRAVVFFALDGAPHEWGHTNWLELTAEGTILGVYPLFAPPPSP